jgi:hypothetical protein
MLTLHEHAAPWNAAHGTTLSARTLGRAIARLGWTCKKKTLAATERNEQHRQQWRERVSTRTADQFVVIDECGSNLNMTPLHLARGWCPYLGIPRCR